MANIGLGKLADGGAGMGKDKKKTVPEKREGKKMATQLAPTPTLYGKDAEEVWRQIQKKPTRSNCRRRGLAVNSLSR